MKQIWGRSHWSLQLPAWIDSHTFPHLPATFFSSWKMQYVLLRLLLLKLLMTSLWLNSKVALLIWTLLIYELVLPLGTVLPSFICRHRQIAPLTLQSSVFLLIALTGCLEFIPCCTPGEVRIIQRCSRSLILKMPSVLHLAFSSCMKHFEGRFSTSGGGQLEKFSAIEDQKILFSFKWKQMTLQWGLQDVIGLSIKSGLAKPL